MKYVITLLIITLSCVLYAQPNGNGQGNGPGNNNGNGNPPCPPNNPHCNPTVPIDGIEWLLIGGVLVGLYFTKPIKTWKRTIQSK